MPKKTPRARPAVAVIGATGYVGRVLCEALAARGRDVRALARPRPADADAPVYPFTAVDVAVPRSLTTTLAGVDAVVNLAGLSAANRDPTLARVNVSGARNVARACAELGIPRLIHFSHLAAQGPTRGGPPPAAPGHEAPMGAHGRTRLRGEREVAESATPGSFVILRPGWLLGPEEPRLERLRRAVEAGVAPTVSGFAVSVLALGDLCAFVDQLLDRPLPYPPGPFFLAADPPLDSEALLDSVERVAGARPALRLPLAPALLGRAAPLLDSLSQATGVGRRWGQRARLLSAGAWVCDAARAREALGFDPPTAPLRALTDALRGPG